MKAVFFEITGNKAAVVYVVETNDAIAGICLLHSGIILPSWKRMEKLPGMLSETHEFWDT